MYRSQFKWYKDEITAKTDAFNEFNKLEKALDGFSREKVGQIGGEVDTLSLLRRFAGTTL